MKHSEIFESASCREVWSRLAQELGAQYWEQPANYNSEGGDGRTVLLTSKEWTVWLEAFIRPGDIHSDSYSNYRGGPESVRRRAPYENKDGFYLSISSRTNFLTAASSALTGARTFLPAAAWPEEARKIDASAARANVLNMCISCSSATLYVDEVTLTSQPATDRDAQGRLSRGRR